MWWGTKKDAFGNEYYELPTDCWGGTAKISVPPPQPYQWPTYEPATPAPIYRGPVYEPPPPPKTEKAHYNHADVMAKQLETERRQKEEERQRQIEQQRRDEEQRRTEERRKREQELALQQRNALRHTILNAASQMMRLECGLVMPIHDPTYTMRASEVADEVMRSLDSEQRGRGLSATDPIIVQAAQTLIHEALLASKAQPKYLKYIGQSCNVHFEHAAYAPEITNQKADGVPSFCELVASGAAIVQLEEKRQQDHALAVQQRNALRHAILNAASQMMRIEHSLAMPLLEPTYTVRASEIANEVMHGLSREQRKKKFDVDNPIIESAARKLMREALCANKAQPGYLRFISPGADHLHNRVVYAMQLPAQKPAGAYSFHELAARGAAMKGST